MPLAFYFLARILASMTAAAIKRLRERLGLTQAQMADRIGVNQSTVHRWEEGILPPNKPCEKLLQQLAKEAA